MDISCQSPDRILRTDSSLTFNVGFTIDQRQFRIRSTVFRIILCDTLHVGFCQPFIDSPAAPSRISVYDEDPEPEVWQREERSNTTLAESGYINGTVLTGVRIGYLIFTRWVNWTLSESSYGSYVFDYNSDISLQVPSDTAGTYFVIGQASLSLEAINSTSTQPEAVVRNNMICMSGFMHNLRCHRSLVRNSVSFLALKIRRWTSRIPFLRM
jgi:hypothetical protein